MNRHFSKKDIKMANKHIFKSSKSLVIMEMQVKITMRYHFTPTSMAAKKKRNKNLTVTSVAKMDGEKLEPWARNDGSCL